MAGLIGSLLGSQPVAGFQRRCGLFPRGEEPRAQAVGNGNRPLTPRDVRNGQRPGVSLPTDCATCNGSPGDGWKVTRATGAGCERSRSSVCSPEPRPLPPAVLYAVTPSPSGAWGNARFLNQECSQDYVVKNYFYYYLFRISAAMGQEVFYITFLPFTYWIINAYVARRLIIMWSVTMYIGQVMKDLLKWPRPHSPPVVKLEKKTNAEYGMPSTHAMAATVISFTFVSVTANQYKYPLELGLLGAFLFSSLVGLSRIYTGMHTVLDVIVGSLISLFLTAIACPTWDIVDHLMLTSPFCPAFCIIVPLFLLGAAD
ncbi:sphingosine-1-phosphate phosphatase 2 [Crotalus adamanteus]|uniref:Sphingosine-1-phosphate phosphatase 2 n=1 Tax=Crotalus adamanteus TaxID=8729 RepID=A0AAW1BGV0_CROAD